MQALLAMLQPLLAIPPPDDVTVVEDGEDSAGGVGGAYNTRCDGTYRQGNMICWVECPVCRIDHGVA